MSSATPDPAIPTPASDRELVISRLINAPPSAVFRAWTEPQQVMTWWGPHGMSTPICEIDLRPGGTMRTVMRTADGQEYDHSGTFRTVEEPRRLVTVAPFGAPGNQASCDVTFADEQGQTRVTARWQHATVADCQAHAKMGFDLGWGQMLERLAVTAAQLATEPGRVFTLSRDFAAPRQLVWDAFTRIKHLEKWFASPAWTIVGGKLELQPDGAFTFGMKWADGSVMWGKWTYREIVAGAKLVFVTAFTDEAGTPTRHPMAPTWPLETISLMSFADHAGGTRLSLVSVPLNPTAAERDTFAGGQDSMRHGWGGTLKQLEDYLAK